MDEGYSSRRAQWRISNRAFLSFPTASAWTPEESTDWEPQVESCCPAFFHEQLRGSASLRNGPPWGDMCASHRRRHGSAPLAVLVPTLSRKPHQTAPIGTSGLDRCD